MSSKSRQTRWFRCWSVCVEKKQILPSGLMETLRTIIHAIGRSFAFNPFFKLNQQYSFDPSFFSTLIPFIGLAGTLIHILFYILYFIFFHLAASTAVCTYHCRLLSFKWKLSKHAHSHRLLLPRTTAFWFARLFCILFFIFFFLYLFFAFVKTFTHRSD